MNIITLRISIDLDETPMQPIKAAEQEELILKAEPLAAVTVREMMSNASKARSTASRKAGGKAAWQTRLANIRKSISPTK